MEQETAPEQQEKITQIVRNANRRRDLFFEGVKRIQAKITQLHKANFHTEAMILQGQAVEHALKEILWGYRMKREILYTLGENDPYADIGLSDRDMEAPLGFLIKKLKDITGETDLVKELTYFNKNFRKYFVHSAYFTTDENYKTTEKGATEYLQGEQKMGRLVKLLSDGHEKVRAEVEALYPG